MFKVIISRKAIAKQETFVLSYKNLFLELYSNTGIIDEFRIRENYISLSKELGNDIEETIFSTLEDKLILGRGEILKNHFSITRKCKGFFIQIEYEENIKVHERIVHNLVFYKK